MLFYALGIFGLGLLLISFFIKGILIHFALFGIWIAEILQVNALSESIIKGDIKTWIMVALSCLMIYSVISIFIRFISFRMMD